MLLKANILYHYRVSSQRSHLLTEGKILTDILWTPMVLPASVLEVPHPPAPPARGVGQLQGRRYVITRL